MTRMGTNTESLTASSPQSTTMLSSPSARPTGTDLSFFSSSRNSKDLASTTTNVTTRVTNIPAKAVQATTNVATRKRKSYSEDVALPKSVKRLRPSPLGASSATQKPRGRSSSARASTPSTRLSSPEPIYRSSRSRSTSVFPSTPKKINRRCWIEEDGNPGAGFISSELVVKGLMRGYKQCEACS
jgi:[histone H3]-lysine79 N-trimethyltransferase